MVKRAQADLKKKKKIIFTNQVPRPLSIQWLQWRAGRAHYPCVCTRHRGFRGADPRAPRSSSRWPGVDEQNVSFFLFSRRLVILFRRWYTPLSDGTLTSIRKHRYKGWASILDTGHWQDWCKISCGFGALFLLPYWSQLPKICNHICSRSPSCELWPLFVLEAGTLGSWE